MDPEELRFGIGAYYGSSVLGRGVDMKYVKNFEEIARDDLHRLALETYEIGLEAADPRKAVAEAVEYRNGVVYLTKLGTSIEVKGSIHVVGFGKASKSMLLGLLEKVPIAGGVVINPSESGRIDNVEVAKGDHPIPGRNTLEASTRLLRYLEEEVRENDLLFVLVSGGGSALFEVPIEGVELEEIAWISRELMKRGADIFELNAVRKHLSKVKGGKLLRYVRARNVVTLIVSDVVGDRIDTIASGPTAPDPTTFRDVIEILQRYGLWNELPPSIRRVVENGVRGQIEETVKPGDPVLEKVLNIIVASNTASLEAMASYLRSRGFETMILTPYLVGEAREVGKVLASILRSVAYLGKPVEPPAAVLAGGETTVTVKGKGVGGRNQEMCLSLAIEIENLPIVALCAGSDGIDGVSPAAGAIVDGSTAREAREKGLDPRKFLENNDSYTFFSKLGRAIITGYTGTNVNDFFVALIPKRTRS